MQISSDEIRSYYASLSDEMLRETDPADLTAEARKWYEHEVRERGLRRGTAPTGTDDEEAMDEPIDAPLADSGDEPDWLDDAACATSFSAVPGSDSAPKAALAREVLLAAGVPCYLQVLAPDRTASDSARFDTYQVLVPGSLALKAESILDKEIFNADLEEQWRDHFAALSDDDLQLLKPETICGGMLDRVERLTRVYREEVARRSEAGPR